MLMRHATHEVACRYTVGRSVGPASTYFEEGEGKKEGVAFSSRAYKTTVAISFGEPQPFSLGVCSVGASSFCFNELFSLENCFAHS